MNISKKLVGLTIASAAAIAFATVPVTSAVAADAHAATQMKCPGGNACKGQSACKTKANACKGQNSCKGKGFSVASSKKECKEMRAKAK